GWIGKETRQSDPPEIAPLEDALDRRPRPVALQMLLLTGNDVVAFLYRQLGMFVRREKETEPKGSPHQPASASENKGHVPVEIVNGETDEWGREHGTHRCADVEKAARKSSFLGGKPFRRSLHSGGISRAFGQSQQSAKPSQRLPLVSQTVCHANERPREGENS